MKTAISLPDPLFRSAETAAKRLKLSRSQLYARALAEFLERQEADAITRRLNEVLAREGDAVDPVLERMQFASLEKESW